jgi:hypothetical protein
MKKPLTISVEAELEKNIDGSISIKRIIKPK